MFSSYTNVYTQNRFSLSHLGVDLSRNRAGCIIIYSSFGHLTNVNERQKVTDSRVGDVLEKEKKNFSVYLVVITRHLDEYYYDD